MGKRGRQRRADIRAARIKKALLYKRNNSIYYSENYYHELGQKVPPLPAGAVAADHGELAHNSTYNVFPRYYVDRVFDCADCESEELWTAKQQKWWYEIAKGNIGSFAICCRPCRRERALKRRKVRDIHFAGIIKKHGLVRAGELLGRSVTDLEQWQDKYSEYKGEG